MNSGRRLALGCAGLLGVLLVAGLPRPASAQAKPQGEMRYALYVTLSPVWFDPGEGKLREGLKSHNGDPFTGDDVKFSFHRAKGSKTLHEKGNPYPWSAPLEEVRLKKP